MVDVKDGSSYRESDKLLLSPRQRKRIPGEPEVDYAADIASHFLRRLSLVIYNDKSTSYSVPVPSRPLPAPRPSGDRLDSRCCQPFPPSPLNGEEKSSSSSTSIKSLQAQSNLQCLGVDQNGLETISLVKQLRKTHSFRSWHWIGRCQPTATSASRLLTFYGLALCACQIFYCKWKLFVGEFVVKVASILQVETYFLCWGSG